MRARHAHDADSDRRGDRVRLHAGDARMAVWQRLLGQAIAVGRFAAIADDAARAGLVERPVIVRRRVLAISYSAKAKKTLLASCPRVFFGRRALIDDVHAVLAELILEDLGLQDVAGEAVAVGHD